MGISPKNLWSYIKSQIKETRGIPPLSQNGSLYVDPHQKAEQKVEILTLKSVAI